MEKGRQEETSFALLRLPGYRHMQGCCCSLGKRDQLQARHLAGLASSDYAFQGDC